MIPQDFISEWKKAAPWSQNDQVEQDLMICRALVEIFRHPVLADNLAFRGGTALFKLHLQPVRYSEDIDLVQVHPGPIGPMLDALQENEARVSGKHGETVLEAEAVVLAIGRRSRNQLTPAAQELVDEVYVIGDCLSPRRVKDAIWEAFKTARVI